VNKLNTAIAAAPSETRSVTDASCFLHRFFIFIDVKNPPIVAITATIKIIFAPFNNTHFGYTLSTVRYRLCFINNLHL
jgi:hypothetical protein